MLYVEPLCDARTKLAGFFKVLLRAEVERERSHRRVLVREAKDERVASQSAATHDRDDETAASRAPERGELRGLGGRELLAEAPCERVDRLGG